MAFKKTEELGMVDPNINTKGRRKFVEMPKRTNREIRQSELIKLIRKLAPYMTKSIQVPVKILDLETATDQNKLRASALLLQSYRQLLLDVYHKDYDTDAGEELQEKNQPVFSLKVINNENDEKTGTD